MPGLGCDSLLQSPAGIGIVLVNVAQNPPFVCQLRPQAVPRYREGHAAHLTGCGPGRAHFQAAMKVLVALLRSAFLRASPSRFRSRPCSAGRPRASMAIEL